MPTSKVNHLAHFNEWNHQNHNFKVNKTVVSVIF